MTDTNLGAYSPDELLLVITLPYQPSIPPHIVSGYQDGSMVSVSRPVPRTTMVNGGDDTGFFVSRKNSSGMLTVNLHQGTASNDFMSSWFNSFSDATNKLDWLADFTLVDTTGRTYYSGSQSFIENEPEVSFSTDGTEGRSWVVYTRKMKSNIGGSARIPEEIVNTLTAMGVTVPARWLA